MFKWVMTSIMLKWDGHIWDIKTRGVCLRKQIQQTQIWAVFKAWSFAVQYSHHCTVTMPSMIWWSLSHCSNISKLIIRGNSKEWLPTSNISDPPLGKEQHLACICTELFNDKHVIVAAHEILLLDDDDENCDIAREFGHQAFQVPEGVTMSDIAQYVKMLEVKKILPCPSWDRKGICDLIV